MSRSCYLAGWNASKRTRTYDLDAAEGRHTAKCDHCKINKLDTSFAAGWIDHASDYEKFESLKGGK